MKYRIAHIFCGIGGKGLGAREAVAAVGDISATFETIGGIDVDPRACRDFEMLVGAPALCADVHELEPADLRRFFGAILGGAPLVLDGTSHTRWREAIGNAVPPRAGRAIAQQLLRALLLSSLGVFALDNNPIWVAPELEAPR